MKLAKHYFHLVAILFLSLTFVQCKDASSEKKSKDKDMQSKIEVSQKIEKETFGEMPNGKIVEQFTFQNSNGMEVKVITYGGRITSLKVPAKNKKLENIVLGFDNLEQYLEENPYFGALIGRFGNRIANGKFSLNGEDFSLYTNDGANHLHGGKTGFDQVVWEGEIIDESSLKLTYISEDMEEGYPGTLKTTVVYTLTEDNAFEVDYKATTDKTTIINLTQHAYFNLSGNFNNSITDHLVQIDADQFLPVDETLIPTGEFDNVTDTPFDFRQFKVVQKDIENEHEQLVRGKGYDHCWVLNDQGQHLAYAASAYHQASGRLLEVFTNEPGIQFYSGNFLDGSLPQAGGEGNYAYRSGFCLETQHFPDAPNQEQFPSVVLEPGETFASKTIFKFSVK